MTDTDTAPGLVVALDWWPYDGSEGVIKQVAFGPVTGMTRVLLELGVDPVTDGDVLTVTAGNVSADGETPADRLRAVAGMLGDLAQLITATADYTEETAEA